MKPTKLVKRLLCYLLYVPVLAAVATQVRAHDLQASRATLVLRDNQHMAVTFLIDYPAVLHQVLAPKMLFHEFALQHAAMPPPVFSAQLLVAQRQLQAATRLMLPGGKAVVLTLWAWPESTATQKALQQRAMEAVTGAKDHAHATPSEIRAEAQVTHPADLTAVKLQLPLQFKQPLVVSYRPSQQWVDPQKPSGSIRF